MYMSDEKKIYINNINNITNNVGMTGPFNNYINNGGVTGPFNNIGINGPFNNVDITGPFNNNEINNQLDENKLSILFLNKIDNKNKIKIKI
jgi:hypothetical protein